MMAAYEFPYLGSLIVESGRMHVEVDKRIANAVADHCSLQSPPGAPHPL